MFEVVKVYRMFAVKRPSGNLLRCMTEGGTLETWLMTEQQATFVCNLLNEREGKV